MSTLSSNSFVLCEEDGKNILYAVGSNAVGQLGVGDTITHVEPVIIEMDIVDITSINAITVAKTRDNKFYAWGLFKYEEFHLYKEVNVKTKTEKNNENILLTLNNEDDENKNEKCEKVLDKLVQKAYFLPKPTLVNCRSFNDFISKYSGLTHFSIDVDEENRILEEFGEFDDTSELVNEEQFSTICFENYVNEKRKSDDDKANNTKISLFDGCNISDGFNLSNVNITGTSN